MPPELGGDGEEIFVMGYDTNRNVYTFDAFSSKGLHQISKGTLLTGDRWIWTSEAIHNGQNMKQKMTMQVQAATSYRLKFELSTDGVTWMTFNLHGRKSHKAIAASRGGTRPRVQKVTARR
jgi:hypothetical protein